MKTNKRTQHHLTLLSRSAEDSLQTLIRNEIDENFDCLYACTDIDILISFQEIIEQHQEWHVQHNGHTSMKVIGYYIEYVAKKQGVDIDTIMLSRRVSAQQEADDEKQRMEGRLTEAKVLHRQRNRQARQLCLEASGYKCYVCGFDFEKAYGEIGKGFLEVHHTKPLATYDDEHPIPQSELCALCSNCHSMVHRKKDVLDVDELKKRFNE